MSLLYHRDLFDYLILCMYVHVKQGNRVQLFACIGVVEFLVVFRFFRIGGSLGHKVAYTAGPQTVSHHPGNQNIR